MILAALGFAVGVVIGIGLAVVFGKNNKNHIAQLRQEILDAVAKVESKFNNKN